MRRIESQRRAPDSCFLRFVGFAYPAPRHETELCRADHRMGDLAEGEISSWEMAWIDLGGEG
jgi:hypothetical protein